MRNIFVYGANRQGLHGKGAALTAYLRYGAEYGRVGLVGNSYGIVTKELRQAMPPVSLEEIEIEILKLYHVADMNPDLRFECTAFGTGLAGFNHEDICSILCRYEKPKNIILPDVWNELLSKDVE